MTRRTIVLQKHSFWILQRNIDSIAFYHQSLYKTTSERVIERLGEPAMKALDCDSVRLEKVIVRDLIEKKEPTTTVFYYCHPFFPVASFIWYC